MRTPFARIFLKPGVYQLGVCEQAAPANVSWRLHNPRPFTSLSINVTRQGQTASWDISESRLLRQRLTNSTVV
jgi:hypothetical protein